MSVFSVAPSPNPILPSHEYHPDFTDVPVGQDAAVTLVSRDGMCFRVNSNVLKAASEFFATTLSLPQPPGRCPKGVVIDNLDEDAQTIEGLLRMITAKEFPRLDTLEVIEPLLLAAEKWDMPGPSSILKILLQNPKIVSKHPMRLYWLGCHLGWDGMTKLASKFSCNFDIFDSPNSQSWLQKLDSTDVIRLMKLHRTRREMMMSYLETGTLASYCYREISGFSRTPAYQLFKWRFLEMMDRAPPGCAIDEDALRDISTSLQLETAKCPDCSSLHWSTKAALAKIKAHWSILPQTV